MCSTSDISTGLDVGGSMSSLGIPTSVSSIKGQIPTVPELTGQEGAKEMQRAQQAAATSNIQLQRELAAEQARQFDIMREQYAPYQEAGVAQLPLLQQMAQGTPTPTMAGFYESPESQIGNISDFQASPGYQFQLQQGLGAIQNAAAAGGGSLESGRTLKALQQYGQNLANQEYQNWYGRRAGEYGSYANRLGAQYGNQFNRLAALAGIGQTATGATSQLGQNQLALQAQGAQNLMNINNQMAQVNAAAAMQPYSAYSNLLGQGAMLYGAYRGGNQYQ